MLNADCSFGLNENRRQSMHSSVGLVAFRLLTDSNNLCADYVQLSYVKKLI
jgi:hypothetical protein